MKAGRYGVSPLGGVAENAVAVLRGKNVTVVGARGGKPPHKKNYFHLNVASPIM